MGERPDRGESNPSQSFTFPFSLILFPSSFALSLPAREPGWKTECLMRVHSSRPLSAQSLHFSNNSHSAAFISLHPSLVFGAITMSTSESCTSSRRPGSICQCVDLKDIIAANQSLLACFSLKACGF